MNKTVILGAGAAGLAAAWMLEQRGQDYTLFEKQSYHGGLARSFEWNGFVCDFAAHRLFTRDEEVLQQLLRLVPMGRHIRRSRIYLRDKWMRDPLDVIELMTQLTLLEKMRIVWTFLFKPKIEAPRNFEEFVVTRYGTMLNSLFFQPYTEKLFGLPGNEISVLWAQQKVRLANPLDTFRESTDTKFNYFYYPIRGGYGAIVDQFYSKVREHVCLDAEVRALNHTNGIIHSLMYQHQGELIESQIDRVISTLPLPITGKVLGFDFPLYFRKVDSVYLLLDRPRVSDLHWIYFIDKDVSINRLVEFKNMSEVDKPQDRTVVCAEVTQEHDNPVDRVIQDLVRIGLIKPGEVLDSHVVREPFSYPIYDRNYEGSIKHAFQALSSFKNLHLVGRGAEFQHREVDDIFARVSYIVDQIPADRKEAIMAAETTPEETIEIPLVTAVVLTFNHFEDTEACITSLLDNDYEHLELLVVDNGSTDGTPEKIRQAFPQVTVIENGQNLGVPAGYNIGFKHAVKQDSTFILMLNNDTVVAPDLVSLLVQKAKDIPQAGVLMPKVLVHGREDEVWSSGGRYRSFPPAILMTDRREGASETLRAVEYAPSCGLLIRRETFESVGYFDPGYMFLYDDWDFSTRVRAHGMEIWYVPSAMMWHKVSRTTGGPISPLFWHHYGASSVRFFRRHGRPGRLSMMTHIPYIILREFVIKGNWSYWRDFLNGMKEGFSKPLGQIPLPGAEFRDV